MSDQSVVGACNDVVGTANLSGARFFTSGYDSPFVSSRGLPEPRASATRGQSAAKDTYDRLCAARTKPNKAKGPQRQGAKKAKQMERLTSAGHVLDPDEATGYRALSARCNFLAQEMPTISYSS